MKHMLRPLLGTILLGVSLAPTALLMGCGGGGSSSDSAPVTFTQAGIPSTHIITISGQQVEANEVLLTLKGSGSAASDQQNVTALVNKYNLGRTVYTIPDLRVYALTTSDAQDLPSLVQSLKSEPTVQTAEYNAVGTAT